MARTSLGPLDAALITASQPDNQLMQFYYPGPFQGATPGLALKSTYTVYRTQESNTAYLYRTAAQKNKRSK
jgi:hypothetical protein